jgi:hypothetical protein
MQENVQRSATDMCPRCDLGHTRNRSAIGRGRKWPSYVLIAALARMLHVVDEEVPWWSS